jgi:hypothetical protein
VKNPFQLYPKPQSDTKSADNWFNGLSAQTRKAFEALDDFISSDSTQVVELKGEWGVGKTYFWTNFVKWSLLHGKLKHLKAYSYVSLFGASSVSSLESAIFSAHQPLKETAGGHAAALAKPLKTIADEMKQLSISLGLAKLPIGTVSGLADIVVKKYYLRNFLICFDDLERMDENISPSSFLGLVSQLKEQQNCKVVLIYNHEKLARNSSLLRAIDEYREKIIDLELSIRPTVQENLEVAWPKREGRILSYERVFIGSGCSNIRIMKKARWANEYFFKLFSVDWPFFSQSIQVAIAALAVIHYGNKELFSDSKAILAEDYYKYTINEPQLYKAQRDFMNSMGYMPAPHHRMILDFFVHGIVYLDSYKGLLRINEQNERLAKLNYKYDMIMSQFSSGFFVPQNKLLNDLLELLERHSGDLSIGRTCEAIEFLQSCEVDVDPSYLEKAIVSFLEREPELNVYSINFTSLPVPVREDIKKRYEAKGSSQSISMSMQRLAGSKDFDPDEIRLVREYTEDQWLEWISNYNMEHETELNREFMSDVFHLVGTFLKRYANTPEHADQETLKRINSALETLRQRSQVDRLRVEMLTKYMQEHY